ncbi:MAG: phosphoglucomutase (alpha-D-glucose-1,6-bisphosphate-dependent) [Candidatus Marinimicrobia bacterium]|nr:phosphoglucomutase (alpha-D-glucose-1,6-bisphosphate-dependent) [Candidatus Neomarinimicrobiota bacterium]
MSGNALAGRQVPESMLINVPRLVSAYYTLAPEAGNPDHAVVFGTSGHRGVATAYTFNEAHILAIVQAVCAYRTAQRISGPLFLAMDTHALSEPAFTTALEVLAANEVVTCIQPDRTPTPTPAVSHAILKHNQAQNHGQADGLILTPSHNPPEHGGIKYNPPTGGPADKDATDWIAARANELLRADLKGVRRMPAPRARRADCVRPYDYLSAYVNELDQALCFDAIRDAKLALCADGLGGSGAHYWERIAERYRFELDRINITPDPTFRFMSVDRDGQVRMDCSSPDAMAGLIKLRDRYDVAFGNDPDFDRHGIVTRTSGLINPNHYLAVAIDYLFRHRTEWGGGTAIGKTLVSSSMIDRVAAALDRPLIEVPVGFKHFVAGLLSGQIGFGGEESAGASFLRRNGQVWTTDKDGIILALLAAEMTAVTGRDPGAQYRDLEARHGAPVYQRINAPANAAQRRILAGLSADAVHATELAGEPILAKLTRAPGNQAPIGGLKVVTASGWFAARPSGTEDIYKIYAESFQGAAHLERLLAEAQSLVSATLAARPRE